jgi:hypothetical protein
LLPPLRPLTQFKIHTVTDDPRFASRDFFVRRRYRDFVWLRGQLVHNCPGAIVPPLPPADKPYKGDDRFSVHFVQRRQAGLELFLRRVAGHSMLASAEDLRTFLEAKVWELQTAKNASANSWTASILDATDASMKRARAALSTKTPDDDELERLRAFASEYHTVVTAAEAAHHSTVATLQLQAEDLSHLGPAFDLLSQSERELSLPFTHMAKELDALRELFIKQVQAENVSGLSALLTFNAGMAASLREVIKERDHALLQYNKAIALLDARGKERQSWDTQQAGREPRPAESEAAAAGSDTSSVGGMLGSLRAKVEKLMDDPERGAKLAAKVSEAEKALEETKAKWDAISASISDEAKNFHKLTNADFAKGLKQHARHQIEFEAAQQREWTELLRVFEQVPSAAELS